MLLDTLGASLVVNLLTGKGASNELIKEDKGIIHAGENV